MTQVSNWTETYKGVTITAEGPLFRATIKGVVTRKPSVAAMRKAIEKAVLEVPVTPVQVLNVTRGWSPPSTIPSILIANGFSKGGRIVYISKDKREVLYHDHLYNPATFPLAEYKNFVVRQQKFQEEWQEFVRSLPLPLSTTEIEQRMREVPEEGQEQ